MTSRELDSRAAHGASPNDWFALLLGASAGTPRDDDVQHTTPTQDARERAAKARQESGLLEAFSYTTGTLGRHAVVCGVFDFRFIGGSMGLASGEKLVRAVLAACGAAGFVLVTSSGGTRVQEGTAALLQMPRAVAARQGLRAHGKPMIAIVAEPTMGGVAASAVATADIILAEPGARLALAGPRATEATGGTCQLYTAESALHAGLIDRVVPRADMRGTVEALLNVLCP